MAFDGRDPQSLIDAGVVFISLEDPTFEGGGQLGPLVRRVTVVMFWADGRCVRNAIAFEDAELRDWRTLMGLITRLNGELAPTSGE